MKHKHRNLHLPKDLGIKVGSKKAEFWTSVKTNAERDIMQAEANIEISTKVIEIAEAHLKEEEIICM